MVLRVSFLQFKTSNIRHDGLGKFSRQREFDKTNRLDFHSLKESSRSRRKAAPHKQMSAALWVGYTDDSETPEMIMKKFEALEKIQQQQRDSSTSSTKEEQETTDEPKETTLDQDQLETLFKETSSFSIGMLNKGDVRDNILDEDDVDINELMGELDFAYDDDEDEESFFRDDDEGSDRKARRSTARSSNSRPVQSSFLELQSDDGFVFTIRKKTKYIDPCETTFTRIPPLPMPQPWAKTVEPYVDPSLVKEEMANTKHMQTDILKFDFKSLKNNSFIGVLIDPPWQVPGREGPGYVTCQQLEKLNIGSVIKHGYIFLWVEKEILPQAVRWMEKKDFVYVENLVWVMQEPNNSIVCEEYQYVRKSKRSLLIFKSTSPDTLKLELRHQRNADVAFDFVRRDKALTEDKPDFVYHIIETLLPTSRDKDKCQLLELWSKKNKQRSGWTTIAQE
ncbi:methyltransferase MT-A70, putative (ISS) [Planoprotostelium fungivorum]|uniref:Methyltransferase MT-A70, putative (ISS) n=1 Tax=Planoprotostelium fungivorum TaxID=1890364 RepID=A0A2P6NKD5_9EUKA|nr:methyltransferase MT-A70, putative (ISS) [Planoprotostelium fungivorum]